MPSVKRGRPERSMWDGVPQEGTPDPRKAKKKINLRSVVTVLQERGLDPIAAICDVLPELDPSMKVRTLLSLAEFVHPKLGRVEVAGDQDAPVQHAIRVTFG
jgi:hypothetical protein